MDIQKLGAKEALSYAIHAEIEANEFYLNWSINAEDPMVKKDLQELADWEASHRDKLMQVYEYRFNERFQRVPNLIVEPALRVKADEFKDNYGLLRVTSVAYLTELTSAEMYSEMAHRFEQDEELRKMFEDLSNMEKGHMQLMLKKYLKLKEDLEGPLML
ncbi:ferritin family protein [Coprothermobacteraceae bacterium]|nr:ferritin family protein [Coprothermobacteraceae bacterium]